MPPQRSVVPDPELSQRARGRPVHVPLTSYGKLNDPQRDKFGYLVSRTDGKLKLGAHSVKRVAHGFEVLGLESNRMGSGSWHRGVADVWSGAVLGQRMCDYLNREGPDPKGKCSGPGATTRSVFDAVRRAKLNDPAAISLGCRRDATKSPT
jgi:hypothetical protein